MDSLRILYTLVVIVAFACICIWAYSKKSKSTFDHASQLPLMNDRIEDTGFKGDER